MGRPSASAATTARSLSSTNYINGSPVSRSLSTTSNRAALGRTSYVESFHARLREECLQREELWTLSEARMAIEDWRWKYNHLRPLGSLGYIIPIAFTQTHEALPTPQILALPLT